MQTNRQSREGTTRGAAIVEAIGAEGGRALGLGAGADARGSRQGIGTAARVPADGVGAEGGGAEQVGAEGVGAEDPAAVDTANFDVNPYDPAL